jgi:two-component system sensor histidine kinase DesK
MLILVWSAIWLAGVLSAPVANLGSHHPARLAAGIVATLAFAAVYEVATWSSMREHVLWPDRPWIWTVILGAFALALVVAFGGDFIAAFLFVAVSAAMTLPERQGRMAVVAVSVATLLGGEFTGIDSSQTWALVITVFMVGIAMTWIRRMVDLIHQLRRAREQVARLAVNQERVRFARDLHDLLGHSLSTIALKTQVARRMIRRDPAAAERELSEVESLTQRSLGEVREAVGGYGRVTLAGELAGAKSALAAAGITATIETDGTMGDEAGDVLAWTIREGVTNVIRHSGARHCDIVVRVNEAAAMVEIADDGAGPPSRSLLRRDGGSGNGLRGLAERIQEAGGRLESGRRTGGGFRLCAIVPTARTIATGPRS